MGDMWRSQKMQLVQMIVQNDAAHAVVNKLGETGIVEFRDVSRRPCHYVGSIARGGGGAPSCLARPAALS